jgi:hypothetical protein
MTFVEVRHALAGIDAPALDPAHGMLVVVDGMWRAFDRTALAAGAEILGADVDHPIRCDGQIGRKAGEPRERTHLPGDE